MTVLCSLVSACSCGHVNLIKCLLSRGIDKEIRDHNGELAENMCESLGVKALLSTATWCGQSHSTITHFQRKAYSWHWPLYYYRMAKPFASLQIFFFGISCFPLWIRNKKTLMIDKIQFLYTDAYNDWICSHSWLGDTCDWRTLKSKPTW